MAFDAAANSPWAVSRAALRPSVGGPGARRKRCSLKNSLFEKSDYFPSGSMKNEVLAAAVGGLGLLLGPLWAVLIALGAFLGGLGKASGRKVPFLERERVWKGVGTPEDSEGSGSSYRFFLWIYTHSSSPAPPPLI